MGSASLAASRPAARPNHDDNTPPALRKNVPVITKCMWKMEFCAHKIII